MTDVKAAFENLSTSDMFQRVDSSHILDLYYGLDSQFHYTLLLISIAEPPHGLVSSKVISVGLGKRRDNRWALSFSLTQDNFKELFFQFCTDMVESSRTLHNPESGSVFLSERYRNWQKMLTESRTDLLSGTEIKGLIGEMLFMKEVLFPRYGQKASTEAWIGPRRANQDFVFANTWYEVKASTRDASEVRVSSTEQLDCPIEGTLAIVALEQTSSVDDKRISINNLYLDIMNLLDDDTLRSSVSQMLLQMGYYPRSEYDDIMYRLYFINQYRITEDFPCLRRTELPNAIGNVRYTMSISAISRWLKERTTYGN